MLTASQIARYSIAATYDSYAAVDELCSGEGNDPSLSAENLAYDLSKGCFFDISVAIAPEHKVVTQIIVFRTKQGYERYLRDGIKIFDQKEL